MDKSVKKVRINIPMVLTWTRIALIPLIVGVFMIPTSVLSMHSQNLLGCIIGREITVSALREWMARVGESGKVKVNWFGKIKAIAQMVSIPMLLYFDPIGAWNVYLTGTILIYIAAILTIYSMFVYLKAAAPLF